MKKAALTLTGAIFLAFSGLTACSSEKKKEEIIDVDLGPNIGTPTLDDKSGGVYFVTTPAGEYIFRLNLKNGNDLMICEMFNNDKYSDLTPEKRDWMPGENLTHFEFSKDNIQLLISLDKDGTPSSKFLYNDEVLLSKAFKSTAKEPVKIYSGTTTTTYNITSPDYNVKDESTYFEELMIIINEDYYFYGLIQREQGDIDMIDRSKYYSYSTIYNKITNIKNGKITYDVPDGSNHSEDSDGSNYINTWERTAFYSEDKLEYEDLYEYEYEDVYETENTYHLLLRRFK